MACFWTNFVGCAEDCSSTPPTPWAGTAFGQAKIFVNIFANAPGLMIDSGDVFATAVSAITLKRIDFHIDTDDCAQTSTTEKPSWFPADFTAPLTKVGAAGSVVSASGMSLAMTLQTYISNGMPARTHYIVSLADLSAAMGGIDVSGDYHFVAYIEVDANNGNAPYYGQIVGNFCG